MYYTQFTEPRGQFLSYPVCHVRVGVDSIAEFCNRWKTSRFFVTFDMTTMKNQMKRLDKEMQTMDGDGHPTCKCYITTLVGRW